MAILGIDEVGRGPLAGPLVVGAVILPDEKPEWVDELRDSKKLSAKRRDILAGMVTEGAVATGLGWVSSAELDEIGISSALVLATKRAVKSVQELHVSFSEIIIDGKVNFLENTRLEKYVTNLVKADDLIKEVSAASIIAKEARDSYMRKIDELYPGYGFSKNVGYGTKQHMEAISKLGITDEHRKSFEPIKSMLGYKKPTVNVVKNTTKIGERGENVVVEYLVGQGHEIIERNFKTYFYEIDIISAKGDEIYFTEVKTRKNDNYGGGFAAIDKNKIKRMEFAAESYLHFKSKYKGYQPLLMAASVNGDFEIEDYVKVHS